MVEFIIQKTLSSIVIDKYFSIKDYILRSIFVPVFCLISTFWHYYRNSAKLKKFLMILRYIEIL